MLTLSAANNSVPTIPSRNPEPLSIFSQLRKVGSKANLSLQAGLVASFACDEIRRKHELPAKNFAFDNLPDGQRLEYFKLNDFGITAQDVLIPIVIFSASVGPYKMYEICKYLHDRACRFYDAAIRQLSQ
ncbi:hypothetical protein [Endozoicomonas acroporae]|uniref:hypothetical protein n=1 Tax=Endozoicomonas acroporae TaxID=1701104 RepID=UPI0015E0916B|nr:hypothetical protein [Endozoicomonas acroporae]